MPESGDPSRTIPAPTEGTAEPGSSPAVHRQGERLSWGGQARIEAVERIDEALRLYRSSLSYRLVRAFTWVIRTWRGSDDALGHLAELLRQVRGNLEPFAASECSSTIEAPEAGDGTEAPRPCASPPVFSAFAPAVTVLLAVTDDRPATALFLERMLDGTSGNWCLLIVDDACSRVDQVRVLVDAVQEARRRNITAALLRNQTPLGIAGALLRGLAHCAGDVVLASGDWQAHPGWLGRLSHAAYAFADAHPDSPDALELPSTEAEDLVDEFVSQPPDCLYLHSASRAAFAALAGDARDRPSVVPVQGSHSSRPGAFLFLPPHRRNSSSGATCVPLLDSDFPGQPGTFNAPRASQSPRPTLNEASSPADIASRTGYLRHRILFVIHAGGGGTPQTNLDLMRELQEADCLVLRSDGRCLALLQMQDGELEERERFELAQPWRLGDARREDYAAIYRKVIIDNAIDLVHVRHILAHTNDLVDVVAACQVPLVLSLHDFYLLCPTIQLLDSSGRYCGGACKPQPGQCSYAPSWMGELHQPLSTWNATWRLHRSELVTQAAHLITTTEAARQEILRNLPAATLRPFSVIEHGRNFSARGPLNTPPQSGRPVRILVPGQLGTCKGLELLRSIKQLDSDGLVEFHFLGTGSDSLSDIGVAHGPYERDRFFEHVDAIRPSFSAILSIWPETYCHTLSESWAAGLPVLASDIGAIKERVAATGGGWLVAVGDAAGFLRTLRGVLADPQAYADVSARVQGIGMPTTADMAERYRAIYRSVLDASC